MATQPDISFYVSNVVKFSTQPTKQHWIVVKRIMRYLHGTTYYGLVFTPNASGVCVGYSDANCSGDLDDRKSKSGYLFFNCSGAVSWRSKKQSCIALSTAEVEYIMLYLQVQLSRQRG